MTFPAVDLREAARLLAFQELRAVPRAACRLTVLQPHALRFAFLRQAGEHGSIHGALLWRAGGGPRAFDFVPDARDRAAHGALLVRLLENHFLPYVAGCIERGTSPQIVVSSGAAAAHLDAVAERARNSRRNAGVVAFGSWLSYFTDRYPVDGQLATVAVTDALAESFAAGMAPMDEDHLGAWLAWLRGGDDVVEDMRRLEDEAMGFKTKPETDREHLYPKIRAHAAAKRRGVDRATMARLAESVGHVLRTVLDPIADAMDEALPHVEARPVTPFAPDLEKLERDAFKGFRRRIEEGKKLYDTDGPTSGAHGLGHRVIARQITAAARRHSDPAERQRMLARGEHVLGVVVAVHRRQVSSRKTERRVVIETGHPSPRIRVNDELSWIEHPRLNLRVEAIEPCAAGSRFRLLVTGGATKAPMPAEGTEIEVGEGLPRFGDIPRHHKAVKERLGRLPWTHNPNAPVPDLGGRRIDDPSAELRAALGL